MAWYKEENGKRKLIKGRKPVPEGDKKISVRFSIPLKKLQEIDKHVDLFYDGVRPRYLEKLILNRFSNVSVNENNTLDRAVLYNLIRELNKEGTNLNQLMRKMHQGVIRDKGIYVTTQKLLKLYKKLSDILVQKVTVND